MQTLSLICCMNSVISPLDETYRFLEDRLNSEVCSIFFDPKYGFDQGCCSTLGLWWLFCTICTSRSIYGFISKEDVKSKLMDLEPGTFLLRFSETNIEVSQRSDVSGYLTLSFVERDSETGSNAFVFDKMFCRNFTWIEEFMSLFCRTWHFSNATDAEL